MIAAILLSTISALAYVSGIYNFGEGQLSHGSWDLQSGSKPYMAVKDGAVYSPSTGIISIATHPVSVEPNGSFTSTFKFKINDLSSDVLVGIGSSGGQTLTGYNGHGSFIIANNGVGGTPSVSAEYTVQFASINDNSFSVRIIGSGIDATRTVTGSMPTIAVLRITNQSDANGPVITSTTFAPTAPTPTPTETPGTGDNSTVGDGNDTPTNDTPTVTPSPTAETTYNSEMMNWYATYYEPPVLSNQSYIYDDNGFLVTIFTSKPGSEIVTAAEPLNMTAPAAPTKTQSPGFEVILAAFRWWLRCSTLAERSNN